MYTKAQQKRIIKDIFKMVLEMDHDKNTTFIDYAGHVGMITIIIYFGKWVSGNIPDYYRADYYMSGHLRNDAVLEEIFSKVKFVMQAQKAFI